jgi:RNA-binding protein Nova
MSIKSESNQTSIAPSETHAKMILKILLPNSFAGTVIGKGGAKISEVQTQSGCAKVVLSRTQEYYPDTTGNQDRVLLISGTQLDQVTMALSLILKLLEQEMGSDETWQHLPMVRMLVHNKLCGALIGKSGTNIKSIAGESGASFVVSPPASLPGLNERVVKISGSIDTVVKAVGLVISKLCSLPSYHIFVDENVNYSSVIHSLMDTDHHRHSAVENKYSLDMQIAEDKIGAVIGKHGHVVTQIQDLLGVTMSISRRGEHIEGTNERACKISGPDEEVISLAEKIVQLKIRGVI